MKPTLAILALTALVWTAALPVNATGPENTIATPQMIAAFERGLSAQ